MEIDSFIILERRSKVRKAGIILFVFLLSINLLACNKSTSETNDENNFNEITKIEEHVADQIEENVEEIEPVVDENEQYYLEALAMMEIGDLEKARTAFEKLLGYKDVDEMINICNARITEERINSLSEVEVGKSILFGQYEQDNDTTNGKEDIEWVVLAREDTRIMLISKYALDCQQYDPNNKVQKWGLCSLRTWLNETFFDIAFNEAEMEFIPEVENITEDTGYRDSIEYSTLDRVFLLSKAEAEEFLSSNKEYCYPTAYAKIQGAYVSSSNRSTDWWLRTPASNQKTGSMYVDTSGSVNGYGDSVNSTDICVRPAIWVNLISAEEIKRIQDDKEKQDKQNLEEKISDFASAEIGEIINFGSYEQDDNEDNGEEEIEWIVLDKTENELLVISKYALNYGSFQKRSSDGFLDGAPSWEKSRIREWLNDKFLSIAFSELEQSVILKKTVIADYYYDESSDLNPEIDIEKGADTEDKVFLLGIDEVRKYFPSNSDRLCKTTYYSNDEFWDLDYMGGNCEWWLRSIIRPHGLVALVSSSGDISENICWTDFICIRPAMWISLE